MLILCLKPISNIALCSKFHPLFNIVLGGRQIAPVSLYLKLPSTNSSNKNNNLSLLSGMARRSMPRMDFINSSRIDFSIPPRMDFNAPPPRLDFGCPSRMPYNGPRMDFSGPPRMDFGYEDTFRGRQFRGPSYMDDGEDFRRPHMKVHCGELREHHAGMTVEISGRVNKQRLGRFLTLKDVNGMTQLVVPDSKPYLVRKVTNIPIDSFMVVHGTVNKRPKHQRNTFMSTGNVEVIINKIINVQVNKFKSSKDAANMSMMQIRNASTTTHSRSLTSEEFKRCASPSISNQFSKRSHNCGELCGDHEGLPVILCGWIESKQGRFIHLRDGYGMVQVVVPTSNTELTGIAKELSQDTIIEIVGKVNMRPEQQRNMTIATGDVEIHAEEIKLLIHDDSFEALKNDEMNVDEQEMEKTDVNSFTTRTFNCGQLRDEHAGQTVTLCGWLEYQRVGKFVILRDGYGRTQLIIPEEKKDMQQMIDKLPYESIIQVTGVVTSRPPASEQKTMQTGKVEVVIQEISVINAAKTALPFNIRDHNKAKEPLRMQYRYLDLRFTEMQRNMRTRSKIIMDMRDFLINQADFVDVETPTLFRATPGGAQEFLVPTRMPGQFYSLVQSPQQFKQMLMAGAIDRYFQIARCYRDEGARPDRQPEFTQLDIEMSFTTGDGVMTLIERLLKHSWPQNVPAITIPFQKLTYKQAMEEYGSDKPDVRIKPKLVDCTEIIKTNGDLVQGEDFAAYAMVFRKPFNGLTHSLKAIYDDIAKSYPKAKLVQTKLAESVADWLKNISKLFGDIIPTTLVEYLRLEEDNVLFLAYGNKKQLLPMLGKIRVEFVNHLEDRGQVIRSKDDMNFMWIVDYPLFEEGDKEGELVSAHHPFTAPHLEDKELMDINPLEVRGQSYDLVLNGMEVGGGSIRIHNSDYQKTILEKLNIDPNTMQHLLDALASGCPPHGGIALGLDRLIATILNTNSIRDVIAFPKGVEGKDPMSGAPIAISEKDKKLYHISVLKEKNGEKNDKVDNTQPIIPILEI